MAKLSRRMGNWMRGSGFETSGEQKQRKATEAQGRLDQVYAAADMPDEELIKRNALRKASARRGSRQRNVLTDGDELG